METETLGKFFISWFNLQMSTMAEAGLVSGWNQGTGTQSMWVERAQVFKPSPAAPRVFISTKMGIEPKLSNMDILIVSPNIPL